MSSTPSSRSTSPPDRSRPEFQVISVEAGQQFIVDVLEHCISRYPDLVEMFHKGVIPQELIELPLSVSKASNLGRKNGSYYKNGARATIDQTAAEYREQLILETIAADPALSKATPATAHIGALAVLFPESGRVTREKIRSKIDRDTRALLQLMSMSWPSVDIRTRMENDSELDDAYKRLDLIAWVRAFNKFCLNSSGNKQLNTVNAEKNLERIKMRGLDLPAYVKDFVKAADNLKAVESLWSDLRIVTLFVKNLNQAESVFNNIYRKFSDKHEPSFIMQAHKLSFAVIWIEDHFKTVIAPHVAEKRQEMTNLNTAKDIFQKVSQSSKKGHKESSEFVRVPMAVLATFIAEKRKADTDLAAATKRIKDATDKKDTAIKKNAANNSNKKDTTIKDPFKKPSAKCFKHGTPTGCSYGDACRFSHLA
jgi:hypothetical protein